MRKCSPRHPWPSILLLSNRWASVERRTVMTTVVGNRATINRAVPPKEGATARNDHGQTAEYKKKKTFSMASFARRTEKTTGHFQSHKDPQPADPFKYPRKKDSPRGGPARPDTRKLCQDRPIIRMDRDREKSSGRGTRPLPPSSTSSSSRSKPSSKNALSVDPTSIFRLVPNRFRLSEANRLQLMDYSARGRWSDILPPASPLLDGLISMGIHSPNSMQLAVIPQLSRSRARLLCAAETGSGKTLAYLLPIMSKLKAEEANDPSLLSINSRPRAVILVPSNELVEQVCGVAKHLSHHAKLRVERLSGSYGRAAGLAALKGPIDMAIGTPAQLLRAEISLEGLCHLAIDEGDTLLSDDFGEQIRTIFMAGMGENEKEQLQGEAVRGAPEGSLSKKDPTGQTQDRPETAVNDGGPLGVTKGAAKLTMPLISQLNTLAICSATIPISLTRYLDENLPEVIRLGSPRLHTASDRVDIRFIDARQPGNAKYQLCADLLARNHQKVTLIFCNTMTHAQRLHLWLMENEQVMGQLLGPPSLLHGGLPEGQRRSIMKRFQSGDIRYLVCTDLASRGLDTTTVGHVIMFEFARNTIDFIHRAGRTGRLPGTRGLVSCLLSSRDTDLAKAIRRSIKSNRSLTSS